MIQEKLPAATADGDDASKKIRIHWNNTVEYINERKKVGDQAFSVIVLW